MKNLEYVAAQMAVKGVELELRAVYEGRKESANLGKILPMSLPTKRRDALLGYAVDLSFLYRSREEEIKKIKGFTGFVKKQLINRKYNTKAQELAKKTVDKMVIKETIEDVLN